MIQGRLFSDELTEVVRTIHFFFFFFWLIAALLPTLCFANLCRRLFFFFWANFLVFWEEFNTPRFYPRIASERKKGSWCNYVLYAILKQIKNAHDGAFRGKGGGRWGGRSCDVCNQHMLQSGKMTPNLFLSRTYSSFWWLRYGASTDQVKAGTRKFSWSNELQRLRSHSASHV